MLRYILGVWSKGVKSKLFLIKMIHIDLTLKYLNYQIVFN
jgi:hypothetical protein